MADHTWEDEAEPAWEAASWVLSQLEHTLRTLADNSLSRDGEFEEAANGVVTLLDRLHALRNVCYIKRHDPKNPWSYDP